MPTIITTERPHYCRVKIWQYEDWYDAVPQMVDAAGVPINLTAINASFRINLRPSPDSTTTFLRVLEVGDGITIENGPLGLISIFLPVADVNLIPISFEGKHWWQNLRMTWTDPILGPVRKHLWEGPLYVYPARTS